MRQRQVVIRFSGCCLSGMAAVAFISHAVPARLKIGGRRVSTVAAGRQEAERLPENRKYADVRNKMTLNLADCQNNK